MDYTINTLEGVSTPELVSSFNTAFADYFVKFELTENSLLHKIISENIQLDKSTGIFVDQKLVGFMLIAIDTINGIPTAYNAGTGVVPACRGNRWTEKMYGFLIPLLIKAGIYHHQLEVMIQNEAAWNVYKKIGFVHQRTVSCYHGILNTGNTAAPVEMAIDIFPKESLIQTFREINPTWQNTWQAIMRTKDQHIYIKAIENNKVVGYLIFSPANFRVKQFAVDPQHRNRGIGKALFEKLKTYAGENTISIINIDPAHKKTISFLEKTGLVLFAEQYEMVMKTPAIPNI